ncbi:MAG: mannose-6-phosphate isomerase, class I [Ilumatobacteraceae bacterium]
MLRLKGAVQHYPWGDRFALPEMLEITADGRPWAEIWYGTHPRGPAHVDESLHLPAPTYLSDEVGELAFLVKLLAAAQPLSLQTHPSDEQAARGFAKENAAGIPLDARHRIYVDDRAKPEMVVALDTFEALCGIASHDVALRQCAEAGAVALATHVEQHGVAHAVRTLLSGGAATSSGGDSAWLELAAVTTPTPVIAQLTAHHDDPRAAVALLMNHVRLAPGEALFLEAGTVHSYLRGVALEVQGNSDNVMRAAFTDKHVDLDEFFAVARLDSPTNDLVRTERVSPTSVAYRCAAPFSVMRHELNGTFALTASTQHTMLVCTSGSAGPLTRGGAAYVAVGESIALEGTATIYSVSA